MGKILYYLLICGFLFLIGSWAMVVVKSCSNTELPSSISDATKSVTSGAKNLANKAKDGTGKMINKAKGGAEKIAGKAKAGVKKGIDATKDAANTVKDKAGDAIEGAKDLIVEDDKSDESLSKEKAAKAKELASKQENVGKGGNTNTIAKAGTTTAKGGSTSTKSSPGSSKVAKPKSYSSGSSSKYMVITGSYTGETNAKNAVKKLKRLGYDKAEVIRFRNSEYYSVCAGRYSSKTSAATLKDKLVSSTSFGDTYVKTRKEKK